jgi:hypothetical protein
LWGKLKAVVYANNPHDLETVKTDICEEIYNIHQRELQQVSRNLFNKNSGMSGRHFEHLS